MNDQASCPKCGAQISEASHFCSECGFPLNPDATLTHTPSSQKPDTHIDKGRMIAGHYRILEMIGKGGMGVVYKAEDLKLERHVALKFLPDSLVEHPEARERFLREARAAAALAHPNICTIHEIREEEGVVFIVMEYIEGSSLKEKIDRAPMSSDEVLKVAIQIATGLDAAHRNGIIHRDIKSSNIMLTTDGQAKIMDFGLAKVEGSAVITRESQTMGTVAYMSPEQARGETVDHRTDIWSFGVVLYEILSGELPFSGDREASVLYSIERREPRPFNKLASDIPAEFEKIISRALKKNLNSRHASADAMLRDLLSYQELIQAEEAGPFNIRVLMRRLRQPRVAIPSVTFLILLIVCSIWFINRRAKINWARSELIPQIEQIVEHLAPYENHTQAYELAQQASAYIPNSPVLQDLLNQCSMTISILSDPTGASISYKDYRTPEVGWQRLGNSPLDNITVPRGHLRWKLEKEGYETILAVHSTFQYGGQPSGYQPLDIEFTLDKEGILPPGMVRVPGRGQDNERMEDFFVDRYEVTCSEYKEFIDHGGYQNKRFWKHDFVKDSGSLGWEEAMSLLVDKSGRPGPSTWEAGDFPEGRNDYPVSGISWYEAAAYAEYRGKSLPTTEHWFTALGKSDVRYPMLGFLTILISLSNFGSTGPVPVGSTEGLTSFGVYDMGGNVREWCWNRRGSQRAIRGGAWDDVTYLVRSISQSPPFDRSDKNGIRCVVYANEDGIPEKYSRPLPPRLNRDFYEEEPVPEEVFQRFRNLFAYDKSDLNATILSEDPSHNDWIKQKIEFSTAHGGERMVGYLFLPKHVQPPFQTVLYFPGSTAVRFRSSENLEDMAEFKNLTAFIIKNDRALFYPVYKGTYERGDYNKYGALHTGGGEKGKHEYLDYLRELVKDLRRSLDYLETREDIDSARIAFYGYSWGGFLWSIIGAVEDRFAAGICLIGGLASSPRLPEADEINYVRHVMTPTLMLNGEYDYGFPKETSARPMFELLGTPDDDKNQIFFESDHYVPHAELVRHSLEWLDRYLGPVR